MKQIFIFLFALLSYQAAAQTIEVANNKYAVDNWIYAIVKDNVGNTYIGGSFTSVGLWSGHGAQLNTTTGVQNTAFPTVVGGQINAVVAIPSGGWFIGGTFTSVNGITRNRLARINADGSLHAFDPNMSSSVLALALDGSNLYAGGSFTTVGGTTTRNQLCKFDATGALTAFDPNMNNSVLALALDGSNLYAGGSFTTVGGTTTRNRLCKFDASGALTAFNPNMNNSVYALALNGSNLYAGGVFTSVGGSTRNRLCKFDASGALAAFDPNINGIVYALVLDGSNLYAGGSFTTIGGTTTRNYLCKFDASGALMAFDPNMNTTVNALAHDGSNLYVGGQFTSVGSTTTRNRLCKFDATGALTAFNPNMNSTVNALALDDRNLYAGGQFTSSAPFIAIYNFPCTTPTAYTLTGGGSYCAGGISAVIGLSNSEIGVTYQLENGASNVGAAVSGTGAALSFVTQTAGTYTVVATRTRGGCTASMSGSAVVTTINCCPSGNILHVNASVLGGVGDGTSWADAYASLSDALAIAHICPDITRINVATGVYKPTKKPFENGVEITTTDNSDKTFHARDGLGIYGGYDAATGLRTEAPFGGVGLTVLSGDFNGDDVVSGTGATLSITGNTENACHVVIASAVSTGGVGIIIDGFTIKGGNASSSSAITVNGNTLIGNYGGGIYANYGTNTLSNNTFSGNLATFRGGGIYTDYGTNTLSNNTLSGNASGIGGGIYTVFGTNTLSNNTLLGNKADYYGGGIYSNASTNTLSNNTLLGNSATYGGGFSTNFGTNTLSNNTLSANLAASGGGVHTYFGTNTLSNNTLSGNSTSGYGGGIYTDNGTNTLSNNIFWRNKKSTNATVVGADYYAFGTNGNTFKNNLLQLASSNYPVSATGNYAIGTAATGNIFATDPLFANASDPDGADNIWRTPDDGLQLLCSSPAYNTGNNALISATTDITGAPRTQFTTVDMGAYESQMDCINTIYTGTNTCQTYTIQNVSGNTWFHIYGENGIIASINPNGENLGTLTVAVSDPTGSSTVNNEKFLGRNINITSSDYPTSNIPTAYSLKLYYYDTEFDDYKTAISNPTATLQDFDIAWASGGTGCTLTDYATSASSNGKIAKASVGEFDYGLPSSGGAGGGSGFYLQFDLNHFTMFAPTISASPNPLPVKLLSFSGYNKDNENILEWFTATEQNNKGFEVERSTDGSVFKKIGFIDGAGNSNTIRYYSFIDNLLKNPNWTGGGYYRLRQIDFDDNYAYSAIVFIKNSITDEAFINVYPNPVNNILNIIAANKKQNLVITDLLGRTILQENTLPETVDMSSFSAGVYFIIAGEQVFKIIKE